MGEIVNLRRVKKQRERAAAAQTAAENRRLHGRTTNEKRAEDADAKRLRQVTDGARIEPEKPG